MVVGEGNELNIVNMEQLGFQAGEKVLFGEIVENGKLLKMSVMGYSVEGKMKVAVGVAADVEMDMVEGTKIVVVADIVGWNYDESRG
ncbi:hypothetical protein CEUSTIGMA_g2076.t1 [Chlamydomonas eustigma]|uniref:Uncharacterized protein n=1 Tax=Chlamydomonas eustigma TaxID=1157962 RepID=A0A250WUX6_9CHLO|nr:hypothetical protein CEUSTIGMA_g2076.t1 [Chlamydomonas eustigma]|eukprot:GAX74628.1 hypothetical protein CEUSTIGMA_g2076.t1 [Chlamydomonas eustigma]